MCLPTDVPPMLRDGNPHYRRPMKTLFLLHGFSGNSQDWLYGSRISDLAGLYNLAVVMPQGDNSFYLNGRGSDRGYEDFLCFEIPGMTVEEMAAFLKERLHLNGLRYIGLRGALLRRVAIVGHLTVNAFGTDYTDASGYEHEYATEVIRLMEQGVDAIIPGEVIDWTAISYIRDAVQQGRNKAVFNVGHYNWEEPGMSYMAEWLAELLGDEIPVRFVPAGDIYRFD